VDQGGGHTMMKFDAPEPGTLSLLLCGALAVIRRGRK
jgi:hypothetical protein